DDHADMARVGPEERLRRADVARRQRGSADRPDHARGGEPARALTHELPQRREAARLPELETARGVEHRGDRARAPDAALAHDVELGAVADHLTRDRGARRHRELELVLA